MATCRECLHQELCDTYSRMGVTDVSVDDITICELFKSKSEYVKRERGEWKYEYDPLSGVSFSCGARIICSRCGYPHRRLIGEFFNFCPICGADMRKEDNNV